MAFKRHIDRLPIVPPDARVHNVTCHFCIVGCGYKAYSWNIDHQGGTNPDRNAFGADLSKQQPASTDAWYAPSMYNIVRQDGRDVHLVIKPDESCVVNSGLGSVRGARMAELSHSAARNSLRRRLTDPLVWRYGQMQPTSWDDALDLVARVTAKIVLEKGEDALFVSAYDHGGAGGGYENTWATGKLYFDAMKIRNIRIHNRPVYNSEVHASRDMGVSELNNCYEDAELADTILVVGANPLETQTNYFLNHWIANLNGSSLTKKRAILTGEVHQPGRIVIVDPRRTVTVNACEIEAGPANVLHLPINSGTDLILLNAWLTFIVEKGWMDSDFIKNSTSGFDQSLAANRTTLQDAAAATGLTVDQIRQGAEWIACPKSDGSRRRTMISYEKGLIWGNDNYRTNGAIVNLALATGNIGRLGGGCVRLGGHQEGYCRPPAAHVGRPAPYVDQLLIGGAGCIHHVWGCDHYKTTLNALEFKRVYKARTDLVKNAMSLVPYGDRDAMIDAIVASVHQGGLFSVNVDIVPSQIGQAAHVLLPAATAGEMNLTSMNGERRLRLSERYMDPPGASMPDCLIAARLANKMEAVFREFGKPEIADRFKGFDWHAEEDVFMDGYHRHEKGGEFVTYARLRAMGTNGFQEPAVGFIGEREHEGAHTQDKFGSALLSPGSQDGPVDNVDQNPTATPTSNDPPLNVPRILGTKRLYVDGRFDTKDGRATFHETPWRGLQLSEKANEREKYPFLINNGRSNHVWQSAYLDQTNDFVMDRYPWPTIEMNPADVLSLGLANGDLVEVYNDNGSTQAMVYQTDRVRPKQTFMLFGYPNGVQGNTVSSGVNELGVPNYKQTWGAIRKLASISQALAGHSFKDQDCKIGA